MKLRSLAAPGGLLAVCVAAGCRMENPGFLPPPSDDETTGTPATTGEPGTTTASLSSAPMPDPGSGEPDGSSTGEAEGSGTIEGSTSGDDTSTTTGAPDTSTGEPGSTGPAAVCGDAVQAGDEACDDGPAPSLEPGACLPDCSGTIATRRIFAMPWGPAGDFAAGWDDPVALADGTCGGFATDILGLPGEFKAMLVDGEHRVAALAPYDPAGAVDWVIRPYTAYTNLEDEIVWVTGEISLLGVLPSLDPRTQPNVPTALLQPIAVLAQTVAWTGLASDWTTAQTCGGWADKQQSGTVGKAGDAVAFLDGAGALACNKGRGFVCVEQ